MLREPGYREPWQQRADETDADFLDFVIWLHRAPRPMPAAQHRALQLDWAGRARSYDAALSERDGDPIAEARENLRLILALETRKLKREAQANPARVMTVRETIELGKVLLALNEITGGNFGDGSWGEAELDAAELLLFGRKTA